MLYIACRSGGDIRRTCAVDTVDVEQRTMAATSTEAITHSSLHSTPAAMRRRSSSHSTQKKPWQHSGRPSFHSSHSRPTAEEIQQLSHQVSHPTTRSRSSHRRVPKWYKIRWFRGMIDDVKRRAPFYWSDWRDAWDYRVVPATVYMYFAKYAGPYSLQSSHAFTELPSHMTVQSWSFESSSIQGQRC